MTLDLARKLPAFLAKSHMTVRRKLEPARIGRWLPPGERVSRVLYNAKKVRELALDIEGVEKSRRTRPVSPLPHECPNGWGTIEEIWRNFCGETPDPVIARMIRKQLHDGVPSERIVLRRIRVVFPIEQAMRILRWHWRGL